MTICKLPTVVHIVNGLLIVGVRIGRNVNVISVFAGVATNATSSRCVTKLRSLPTFVRKSTTSGRRWSFAANIRLPRQGRMCSLCKNFS